MSRSFNGTTDYISAGDLALLTGLTQWTKTAWCQPASLAAEGKFFAKWSGGDAGLETLLSINTSGHIVGAIHDGTAIRAITGTATYSVGQWVLAVLRQNGTGAGSLTLHTALAGAGSLTADGSSTTDAGPQNTTTPLLIGSGGVIGGLENPFSGLTSRCALWTVRLTDPQANALLTTDPDGVGVAPDFWTIDEQNATPTDLSGGGVSLTVNGTTYDSDEPFSPGGGGNGGAWYYYQQMRQRTRRLWRREGLIWTPSYARAA